MKLWRKLAFTGVSALLLGILAACGGFGSKDQAEASNLGTSQVHQVGDKPDNFDQLMEVTNERTEKEIDVGVNINYVDQGDYEREVNVVISSEENYDVALANSYVSNARKGTFTDLTELAPKYTEKAYNDLDKIYVKGDLVDGKLYTFPVSGNAFAQQVLTFNKVLLDKCDLSTDRIQSYTDAEKILKGFHGRELNITAFAIGQGFKVQGSFGYPLGNILPLATDLGGDNSKIINQHDNETCIRLLRTIHSWYKQGLIPSDAAASNKDYPLGGNTWLMRGGTQGPYDYGDIISTNAAEQELVSKAITVPLKSTAQAQVVSSVISNTSKSKEKSVELLGLLNNDPELLDGFVWRIEGEAQEKVDSSDGKIRLLDGYQSNTHMSAWNTRNNKILYTQGSATDDMTTERNQSIADVETSPISGFSFNTNSIKIKLSNISNAVNQCLDGLNIGTIDPDRISPKLRDVLDRTDYNKVLKGM